jgi:hypothetical protein
MRSIEGEGDRAPRYPFFLHRADPITLTRVRCAPSTSPARGAGEVG